VNKKSTLKTNGLPHPVRTRLLPPVRYPNILQNSRRRKHVATRS